MTSEQLGFGFDRMHADERSRGLPSTMEDAIPYYRELIDRHHAAMMNGESTTVMAIREEAYDLANKLNGGEPGILAGPDAPGRLLERHAAAPEGETPRWGQRGNYVLQMRSLEVRVEQDGLFGIGCGYNLWPGFAVRALHQDAPFLSETGYRSFAGAQVGSSRGITPDQFVRLVVEEYIQEVLKGKLVRWSSPRDGVGNQRSGNPGLEL